MTFESVTEAMKRKTAEVSRSVSSGADTPTLSTGFDLLLAVKRTQLGL
jgi:hypothetical protein